MVEDDPDHSLLIQLAFQSGDPLARIQRTARAEEAIAILLRGLDEEAPGTGLPAVIVLDLALPALSGRT